MSSSSSLYDQYSEQSETAINKQIHHHLTLAYTYEALYCYFERDNVGLCWVGQFFTECTKVEHHFASCLTEYQLRRGGHVQFESIPTPKIEFPPSSKDKSDIQLAFEIALAGQKKLIQHLHDIYSSTVKDNDPETGFVVQKILSYKVKQIYHFEVSIGKLNRIGNDPTGIMEFNRLLEKHAEKKLAKEVRKDIKKEIDEIEEKMCCHHIHAGGNGSGSTAAAAWHHHHLVPESFRV